MKFPDIRGVKEDIVFGQDVQRLPEYLRWLADCIERGHDKEGGDRVAVQKVSYRVAADVKDFPMETMSITFCNYRIASVKKAETA